MYIKKTNIFLLCLLVIFVVQGFFSEIFAGEIDAKFQKFLLSQQEVPEYSIRNISHGYWPLGPDARVDRVDQDWNSNNGKSGPLLLIAIFNSEEAAIRATYYYPNTTQSIWIWGSLFDGILGLHSWRSLGDNLYVLFAYGNIGVLITCNPFDDQEMIPILAAAQMEKIDQNLAPEILQYRETLRQSRLSPSEYDNYKAEAVTVDLSGFTKITDGDSLWLMKDKGVKMGIRREWEDEKGRVVGIDICKLESKEMAEEVASERAKMTDGKVVSELGAIPWNDKRSSKVLVQGNAVIHVYYFNHKGYSSGTAESPRQSSFLFSSVPQALANYMRLYPYTAYTDTIGGLPLIYYSPASSFSFSAPVFGALPLSNYFNGMKWYPTETPRFSRGVSTLFDYGIYNNSSLLTYPYPYQAYWQYYDTPISNMSGYYLNLYPYNLSFSLPYPQPVFSY